MAIKLSLNKTERILFCGSKLNIKRLFIYV